MGLLNQQKAALERLTFSELIPVFGYDEDTRTFGLTHDENPARDCAMDIAAAWYGIPSAGINKQMEADLMELLSLEYPADTLIQVQRLATNAVDATIDNYVRPKEAQLALGNNNGLTQDQKKALLAQIHARAKFLTEGKDRPLIKNTSHCLKDELVFFTVKIKCTRAVKQRELHKYRALFDRVESLLEKLHIRPKRMDAQAYMDVMGSVLRMGESASRVPYDPERPIRNQITHGEDSLVVEDKYCRVNGKCVSTAYAHTYPPRHHLRNMLPLFGDVMGSTRQISNPYMATLNIIIPDHLKARNSYNQNRGFAKNFAERGSQTMLSWFPKIKHKADQFGIMDKAIADDSAVLCKAWFGFTTFSDTPEEADDEIQNFKTMARGFGWDFRGDGPVGGMAFIQNLPLCAEPKLESDLQRYQTKAAIHVAHLMPIIGEWAGNSHQATQLYISRRGSLTAINTWESSAGYNLAVIANTGAGKSVTVQDFALNNMAMGVKVSILDKGRSSKNTILELGGQFFDFDDATTYNLNPFLQVKDIDEETDQISIIFQTMADPQAELTNYQKPKLTQIIREGWAEHGHECSVDWVAERCLADEDQRIRDIGEMLAAFCSGGQYAAWFNEGEPLTFGGNMLTGIEMSSLDNKPNLQAVVLQMVLMELQRLMYLEDMKGTGRKSVIMIDEAADLLKLNGPAAFAEKLARQARKYGAGLGTICQLLTDYKHRIPTGMDILGNCAFKVLMQQRQETIQELKTTNWAGLNDYEVAMLETVHTAPGRYSEALFVTPNGSGVGRLVLPRYDQLLYTTEPGEKAAIKQLKDQGLSTAEAIEKIIQREQEGEPRKGKGLDQRRVA